MAAPSEDVLTFSAAGACLGVALSSGVEVVSGIGAFIGGVLGLVLTLSEVAVTAAEVLLESTDGALSELTGSGGF